MRLPSSKPSNPLSTSTLAVTSYLLTLIQSSNRSSLLLLLLLLIIQKQRISLTRRLVNLVARGESRYRSIPTSTKKSGIGQSQTSTSATIATHMQMDEQSLPGLHPLWGRCPASSHSNLQPCKAGQRVSLTTYCPWATCFPSLPTAILKDEQTDQRLSLVAQRVTRTHLARSILLEDRKTDPKSGLLS